MRISLFALTALLVTASADHAAACSCAFLPAERIMERAAVFTGVAQASIPAKPGYSITTFRVTEGFKGARAGTTIRILHRSGLSASCGVRFERGASHTLFASAADGTLSASLCTTWGFRGESGPALIAKLRALRNAKK